mmetsp:Transcript_16038/g.30224  ORF Transcript_16038/g.30224 Transcript_16038/m.30224 type:complete len:322 (+) Transcript_16038:1074-2039(+)
MAARRPGADVRAVLCRARTVRGRLCRRGAQGQGHVLFQQHQGGRLPDDAVRHPPAGGLCGGRPGGRGLFAGQVRHPDRAAAAVAAGQGQRLDRGPDHRLHHPRCAARRPADRRPGVGHAAVHRPADDRHRHRHPARGRHRQPGRTVCAGGAVQPAHPAHDGAAAALCAQRRRAGAGFLGLQQPALAGQAGPDLARDHDPVLGRQRQSALHRAGLGRRGPGLWHPAGLVAGGRGGHRHGGGCGRRVALLPAGPRHFGDPAGHRDGCDGDLHELHPQRLGGGALPGLFGRDRRLSGGADECAAAAPRPQPDGRRPQHRGAELQ